MSGLPPAFRVEVEWSAGTWTDVTADVDWGKAISVRVGRSSEFSAPQVASISFELEDSTGKYTARNSQSPYWPNVLPRKRIRLSINSGANVLGVFYAKSFDPTYDGTRRICRVTANDRFDILSRRNLRPCVQMTTLADAPLGYWPLADASGTPLSSASELTGKQTSSVMSQQFAGLGTLTTGFGASNPTPNADSLTGYQVHIAGGFNSIVTRWTAGQQPVGAGQSMELWFTPALSATGTSSVEFGIGLAGWLPNLGGGAYLGVAADSNPGSWEFGIMFSDGTNTLAFTQTTTGLPDGPFHVVITSSFAAGTNTLNLYVNGSLLKTSTLAGVSPSFSATGSALEYYVQQQPSTTGNYIVSNVAYYGAVLNSTQVAAHYHAGNDGFTGDTTGARAARYLGWAGLSAGEYNLATGIEVCGPHPIGGKSVVQALQELAVTEGGGAAAFVDTDGRVRFIDRTFRNAVTPAITVDAVRDLNQPSGYAPTWDELTLVNESSVQRNGGTAVVYDDLVSQALYGGISTDSATTFASTDQAALNLAQDRVARQAYTALRIPQVAVDLYTAETVTYATVAALTIGSRLRVASIATTEVIGTGATVVRFPRAQVDGFIEGWTATLGLGGFVFIWDVSPADAPPRFIWDDAVYGRWQADPGSMTLTGTITAAASSLQVTTAGSSPLFSTSAGDYPLYIVVDDEVMQVSTAPGGSSPQTMGTLTRGAQGTIAAPHTAGAVVNVWPTATWNL